MSSGLYLHDTGEGRETLVLVHGFAGSHRIWDGVLPFLSAELRVLAPDLPGHGRSLDLVGAGKAKACAAAVINALDERGVNHFHLAGHSFGGAVAVLMALQVPERVKTLTLLAPGGFGPEIDGDILAQRARASDAKAMQAALEAMMGQGKAVSQAMLDHAMQLAERASQREKLIEISDLISHGGRQGAFPKAMLEALGMPVRVAWGTADAILPVRQSDGLPSSFAVHRFEGLGHMLPEEAPQAMADLLSEAVDTSS